jgi:hypothetical protein
MHYIHNRFIGLSETASSVGAGMGIGLIHSFETAGSETESGITSLSETAGLMEAGVSGVVSLLSIRFSTMAGSLRVGESLSIGFSKMAGSLRVGTVDPRLHSDM